VAKLYDGLQEQAAEALDREGFDRASHRYERSADLRYVGQAFEVRVPCPAGEVDHALVSQVATGFHQAHERLYGYSFMGDARQPVEWVNLRVSGVGPIARPELARLPAGDGDHSRARTGTRAVYFDSAADTPIFWRADLAPGDTVEGPAVIEEFGSTVPVHPGFTVRVDPYGNLLVTKDQTR
jgi:N-methylhydantoinase A